MIRHEDYLKQFEKDVEVPEEVWTKFEETLDNIEVLTAKRREEAGMKMKKKRTRRTWMKAAVVAGVVTVGGSLFCYHNPAIASHIPIIGNIFEQVENDVSYAGDYEKKEVLNGTTKTAEKDSDKAMQEGVYTAKSKGITITASEVYCDGYSVYLTAKVEAEKGGFENIPEYYTRRFGETKSKLVSTNGTWEINDLGEEVFPSSIDFEGKTVDDHTFIGMIKLDLKQYSKEDGMLNLHLSDLWYDDKNVMDTESIEPANRIKGDWKLTVPYSVDKEQCKEVLVNAKNKEGYGIQKVFVSPYQVIVFSETPSTCEEASNEKQYEYCEFAMFNQDKEALEEQYGDETKTVFAVQGKKISKLHIFMGDESHELELLKAKNEQEAKEMSILETEVNLK